MKSSEMPAGSRTEPSDTKLVICVRNAFKAWNPPPELAEGIRSRWPEMKVVHLTDLDGLDQELPDTDIFVAHVLRPEQLSIAHKLKWIHSFAAGVAQLMSPELMRGGVQVTNASSVHCIPIAQHILGALLALARRFPDCFRYQQQAHWAQQDIWNVPVRPPESFGAR